MRRALLALFAAAVAAGCRPATVPVPSPVPEPLAGPAPLPLVPLVEGPLAIQVAYPRPDQLLQSSDSNFIMGSVGNGRAALAINGQSVRVWPNGTFLAFVPNPSASTPYYHLVAAAGADIATAIQPVRVAGMIPPVPDSLRPPPNVVTDTTPAWVVLGDSASVASDTDRVIIGRPGPNSVYRWFLLPGTRAQLTARYPGFARIRLDSALEIWVDAADARTFAADSTPPRRVAGNARVQSAPGWSDLIIPITERPALFVEERPNSIDLTLYDTRSSTDMVNYPTSDSLIRHVEWAAERSDRVRYNLRLSHAPFGYLVLYENGALVLRVRRPPASVAHVAAPEAIAAAANGDRQTPGALSGLTIVVDPGHPPGGAIGPSGFTEADAVLPVGLALERLLRERGADVVMTRRARDTVALAMRPVIARRANGHAFVSLHYNAYGDGVNPFTQSNGMEVYFYRPHSEPLARAVQLSMLHTIPLADRGVFFRSLAVVRNTWMPAILVEGGFMMIPEQEHAMKTPEFQERYARAVADGLEAYFRGLRPQN